MNLILCGLPLCGKSTIGQRLANQLACHFYDTDKLIEQAYKHKANCREIFLTEGESFFRALEKQQIHHLSRVKDSVIATGGGSLCDPENVKNLQLLGCLIYLKADPKLLWKRHKGRETFAFLNQKNPAESYDHLALTRMPIYEAAAQTVVEIENKDPEEIVFEILEKLSCKAFLVKGRKHG